MKVTTHHLVSLALMGTIAVVTNACHTTFITALENKVWCTADCINRGHSSVWGTFEYSEDSLVCSSAVHAGVLNYNGGWVSFKPVGGRVQQFIASIRNRVISQSRSSGGKGFFFTKEKAIATEGDVLYDELMIVHNSYNLQESETNFLGMVTDTSNYLHLCCISSQRDIKKEDIVNWEFDQIDAIAKGSNRFNGMNIKDELSKTNRRAVKCLSSMPQYDVTAAIQAPTSLYLAPSSSFTVNAGDNLTINIKEISPDSASNEDSHNIFLRRLPLSWSYRNDELASQHNEIHLESAGPGDSGIFIAGNSKEKSVWSQSRKQVEDKGAYFRVTVRDCGRDHWGLDCREWCPECQHGGQCHPNTGICICPPGYYGTFCQHGCDTGKFGSDCNFGCEESTLGFPAEQVCKGLTFCLPDPYGCSCAPGFTGSLCNQVCNGQNFGPNCGLSCDYCIGGCDTITGVCFDACVEGILCIDNLPLMLPYLAQAPKLSNISSNAAALSFHSWMELLDAGLQQTPILSYLVQMRKHDLDPWVQVASRPDGGKVILAELFPGQEYHVRVVISTVAGIEQGDTSHRRVQEAIFTTLCSEEVTTIPVVSNISQSSVILTWSSVEENQEFCDTQYKVNIVDDLSGRSVAEETSIDTTIEVANLLPDHDYTAYLSVNNTLDSMAISSNISFTTLALAPGPPDLTFLQREMNQFVLTWNLPLNSSPAEHYDVNYKFISYGGCNDTLDSSTYFRINVNETELVFTDLQPYSKYIFCVVASNKGGDGPLVCEETYTPPIKGPSLNLSEFICKSISYRNYCSANYSGHCHEVNGPGLRAQLDLVAFIDCSELNSTLHFISIPVNGYIEFELPNVSPLLSGISYNATLTLYNNISSGSKATTELATAEQVPGQVSSLHGQSFHHNYSHWVQLYIKLPCPPIGPPTVLQVLYSNDIVNVSLEDRCEQKEYDNCPIINNLLTDNLYNLNVRLGNSKGWGNSSYVTIRTLQNPPWPPVILIERDVGGLKVSWEVDREGTKPQYYYMLYKFLRYAGCVKHHTDGQSHHLTLRSTQVLLDQLESNAVYNICVQAKGLTGDSPFTCQQYVTQPQTGPALDIEGFQCISDYNNKAICSARIIGTCRNINGLHLEAHLNIKGSVNCTGENISIKVNLTLKEMVLKFITDTSLQPGIEYNANLLLRNEFGEGTYSQSYFMTNAAKPPPVVNPSAISVSSIGAVLQWSAPCPDHGRIIRYYINDKPLPYIQKCENISGNTYCYKVQGFKPGMQYRFKIEAENLSGKSDANFISLTTDLEYPSAPVSVKSKKGLEWLDISIGIPEKTGGPLLSCTVKVIGQNHTCTADIINMDVAAGYVKCNISGLDAGKKYLTSEFCCNGKGCSEEINTTLATLPTKPKLMGNIGLLETKSSNIKITLPYVESTKDQNSYVAVIVHDISNGNDYTTIKLSEVFNKIRKEKEPHTDSSSNIYDVKYFPHNNMILTDDKDNEKRTSTISNSSKDINIENSKIKKDIYFNSKKEQISSFHDMADMVNEGFIYIDPITDNYFKMYEDKRVSSPILIDESDGSGESYLGDKETYTGSGESYLGSGEIPHLFTDIRPFGDMEQRIHETTFSPIHMKPLDNGNAEIFDISTENKFGENIEVSTSGSIPIMITQIYTKTKKTMQQDEVTIPTDFLPDKVEEKYISECSDNVYIAGILFKGQEEFNVGDGKSYGGYRNCPLQPGHKYKLGFVAVTHLDGEEQYSEQSLGTAVIAKDEDSWYNGLSEILDSFRTMGLFILKAMQSPVGVICFIVAVALALFGFIIPALFCWALVTGPVFFINKENWNLQKHQRELGDGTSMDAIPCEDIPMVDMNFEKK